MKPKPRPSPASSPGFSTWEIGGAAIGLILALWLAALPWLPGPAPDLVRDGGFDLSPSSSPWRPAVPQAWSLMRDTSGYSVWAVAAGIPLTQTVPARPLLPVHVSFRLKGKMLPNVQGQAGAAVRLMMLNGKGEEVDRHAFPFVLHGEWESHSCLVFLSTQTRQVSVELVRWASDGPVGFDDIHVINLASAAAARMRWSWPVAALLLAGIWLALRRGGRWRDVVAVAALAGLVGSAAFLFVRHGAQPSVESDAKDYEKMAMNLLAGNGFRFTEPTVAQTLEILRTNPAVTPTPGVVFSTYRPPLYPAVLGALWRFTGPSAPAPDRYRAAYWMQAAGHLLMALLVYGVARRFMGPPASFLAGLIAGMDISLMSRAGFLLVESFQTFVIAAATLALMLLVQKPTRTRAAAAGVLWGLACYTKQVVLILPFLVGAWMGWREFRQTSWPRPWFPAGLRTAARLPAVWLVAAAVLTLAPWTIRNALLTHRFIPVHAGGFGLTLLATTEDLTSFTPLDPHYSAILRRALTSVPDPTAVEVDRAFTEAALENIRRDPASYVRSVITKLKVFWEHPDWSWWYATRPDGGAPTGACYNWALDTHKVWYTILMWLALAGAVFAALRRDGRTAALLFVLVYYTVFHAPVVVEWRYSGPVRGLAYVLSVYALVSAGLWIESLWLPRVRAGLAPALAVLRAVGFVAVSALLLILYTRALY